ncbi:hypothetical protein OG417_39985 [Actinoallomurus sp. NBC_01490]|uniref:hypothetical protein n=1 Tax=Actinoallomurus sp. NBC_01490 TaxID=2903557 RepID=UPI002E34A76C|nr:hypothetical protein [Actinoallomurus sp. NBC_01490]
MSLVYIAGVACVSAYAMSCRYFADAVFHFMSTYAHAKAYQVMSFSTRCQETGRPVRRLNASPFFAAGRSSARKLSACARRRKDFLHHLGPTFQRTV